MATHNSENESSWAITESRFLNANPDLISHSHSHSHSHNNHSNTDQSSAENIIIKKRGRPRKYHDHNKQQVTRSRGRPKGSTNKNKLSIYDHISNFFTFKDFTPHMITVNVGEDVVSKLMGLPMGPRSLTIISARGAVVYVTIRHPSGLHQNFQGVHKILFLSLSCLNEITLEVGLSDPNGKFIVGVASLLIAGTPVEIILGSFIQNSGNKQQIKSKFPVESSMAMATTTTTTTTTSNALGTTLLLLNSSYVDIDQEAYMPSLPESTPAPIFARPINNGPNINSFMF